MKTKKIYILLICGILLSAQTFAVHTTFKELSDNWLKQTESNEGRPGIGDNDIPPEAPQAPYNGPVGDAFVPLLLLASIYGICRHIRRKSLVWNIKTKQHGNFRTI